MKVSLSTDAILCCWLDVKHWLTKLWRIYQCNISIFSLNSQGTDISRLHIVTVTFADWTINKRPRSAWDCCFNWCDTIIIIIIYRLTARVVGAPQMISQPVSSIFPCSPLPSGTCRTPGLSIPWCCLPTYSSVCLVFFPLSSCLARWFWPDLMIERHDRSLRLFSMVRSSCGPIACWILARTSSLVTWSLYEMRSILR